MGMDRRQVSCPTYIVKLIVVERFGLQALLQRVATSHNQHTLKYGLAGRNCTSVTAGTVTSSALFLRGQE